MGSFDCRPINPIRTSVRSGFRRGLASPDLGDCLAMTLAVDIVFCSQRTSQLVYQFPAPNAWMGY